MYTGFWWGSLRERGRLEDLGVDGTKIMTWSFRQWDADMDWIDLAQDKGRWRTLAKAVMGLPVP